MAYIIPVKTPGSERGEQLLIIVLTKDNLDRMRAGDPFDFQARNLAQQLALNARVDSLDIVVAYEEDEARIQQFAKENDIEGLLRHIERGRVHRPGDAVPPVSIKGKVQ